MRPTVLLAVHDGTAYPIHTLVWTDTFVQWIRHRRSGLIVLMPRPRTDPICASDLFSDSVYEEQKHRAESELALFIASVTTAYGSEQARLAAEDWLDESELIDSPPRSEARNWQAVTVAASARLADRLNVRSPSADGARFPQ